jgi:Tfp pilus assembly protein PilX
MSTRLNRRGATLPLALLVIGLLGVAVAITYARLSAERRITGDAKAEMDAFTVAQSGLARYFANLVNGTMPPANQTVTYNDLPNGTAQIDLRRIRDTTATTPQLPAVYAITSRGTNTAAKRYGASTPVAQRTVGTYAMWTPMPFDLNGAWTSLSGLDKNGNSGALDGNDHCAGSGVGAISGVAVPTGTFTGDPTPINGSPEDTPRNLGPSATAKDSVGIDWAGITAGTTLPPDYLLPAWPTAAQMNNWPVTKAVGDLNLPSDGKGILIVTGNLTINGSQTWSGLILVGGIINSSGNNTVYGAVITGLNIKLGMVVPQQSIGNGNKTYQYDSCNLARALSHIGSLQRVRNGWVDTWPSY